MSKKLFLPLFFIRLLTSVYVESPFPHGLDFNQSKSIAVTSKALSPGFSLDSLSIQNNLLHEDLNYVLQCVLKVREGKVAAIVDTFSSEHTNWVWKIQEGDLPKNIVGQSRLDGGAVLTIFDYQKLRHSTDLFVASNILHEMVHAYITLYYRCDPFAARKDYPQIQAAWQRRNTFNYNDVQHREMERRFAGDIATALREYSKGVNLFVDDIVFSDLAWGGLNFWNNDKLSYDEKRRIHNRLLAELSNSQVGDEKPAGVAVFDRR